MRLLIDTQILLWWLLDSPRLKPALGDRLDDPRTVVLVSVASLWEIAIKMRIGKLQAPDDLPAVIERRTGLDLLPIAPAHAWAVASLPAHHGDPFDRLLIAQARIEGLTLVSADPAFRRYEIALLEG